MPSPFSDAATRAADSARSALAPFVSDVPSRTATALVVVAFGLVGFVPLFDGPGYESSLAAGLLLPTTVALVVALGRRDGLPQPAAELGRGAAKGLAFAFLAYGVSVLHGLRAGFCSLGNGSVLFVLGPAIGAVTAGMWGAIAGEVAARVRRREGRRIAAIVVALSGPWGSLLWSVLAAFFTPVVFAFDPFFGYFSGALYDTVIDGVDRLAVYRLGTLATLLFTAGLATLLERNASGRLALVVSSRWRVSLTIAALAASLTMTAFGDRLGHWQTAATIRRELGEERDGARCHVVYPRTLRDEQAELFTRDCDEQAGEVATYLGVVPPRVTVYLFNDAAQKRRLMGAAETYIAKPWRHEVYVQLGGYPHPVLGHELAHAIASAFAPAPLHVAGRLGGLLPDPGLIEGLATDASPDDDELSPAAWSHAMLELGLLPHLDALFSFGFLGRNASTSYTAAGAFVGFVHASYGAAAVRAWYGGEPLERVTGQSRSVLESAFRRSLADAPLPPNAMAIARARFDRPGVFGRRCPHERDAARRDAAARVAAGDVRGGARVYGDLALADPRDANARLGLAACAARVEGPSRAFSLLEGVARDGTLPRTARDQADERLGDLALRAGNLVEAERRYADVAGRVLDEDLLRTLDVKREAVRSDVARPAIVAMLVGATSAGPEAVVAAEELGRWTARDDADGLPWYLLGKSAAGRGDYARASALFEQALSRGVELPRVAREAARQRVVAACARRDAPGVASGLAAWSTASHTPTRRDASVRALAARCLAPDPRAP